MQGNKCSAYEFPETEKDMYHIKITDRIIHQDKTFEEIQRVAIMSPRDYENFKKPEMKTVLGYFEAEILHDPTATVKEPKPTKQAMAAEPVPEENLTGQQPIPESKPKTPKGKKKEKPQKP
jgi:hypothetical protein